MRACVREVARGQRRRDAAAGAPEVSSETSINVDGECGRVRDEADAMREAIKLDALDRARQAERARQRLSKASIRRWRGCKSVNTYKTDVISERLPRAHKSTAPPPSPPPLQPPPPPSPSPSQPLPYAGPFPSEEDIASGCAPPSSPAPPVSPPPPLADASDGESAPLPPGPRCTAITTKGMQCRVTGGHARIGAPLLRGEPYCKEHMRRLPYRNPRPIPASGPSRPAPTDQCSKCKQMGHWRAHCPNAWVPGPCDICGEMGHFAYACSRG